MADLQWEDPPVEGKKNRQWTAAFVEELKLHPGKWARVVSPHTEYFSSSTSAKLKLMGCETRMTTKEAPSGMFRMWARWPEI
jgi:hypothetical protein